MTRGRKNRNRKARKRDELTTQEIVTYKQCLKLQCPILFFGGAGEYVYTSDGGLVCIPDFLSNYLVGK